MTEQLKEFLSYYLPGENLQPFLACFKKLNVKKNKHLLKPGMDCSYIAFIQEGCFRVYHYDRKGKEIITWFSFDEMIITDLLGLFTNGKAQFYVEALEDAILYKISMRDLEVLYKKYPAYLEFGRRFAEEALTMLMHRTMSLHTKSAEERYNELLKTPQYIQKIPLKYLASFLGITDTSLSRLRAKIK